MVERLGQAGLAEGARVIMEKPFGTDLASAKRLNALLHEVFDEQQVFRIDHFLGKEAAQNILALRFANGLFEPIWNRNHIEHVQIDVPETLEIGSPRRLLREDRRLPRHGRHPPDAGARLRRDGAADGARADPDHRGEEQGLPVAVPDRPRPGRARPVRGLPGRGGRRPRVGDRDASIALRCEVDNWRWSGVPFYLRTGKRMAEGARIISIAFREPPQSMFPEGSGVGEFGPDHLTFDLDESGRLSLSFYGKRPGPGHASRQAQHAVLAHRRRPRAGDAGGIRAADPRRDGRRPHAVHDRAWASSACGRSPPRCSSPRRR